MLHLSAVRDRAPLVAPASPSPRSARARSGRPSPLALVEAARGGNQAAWSALVKRFDRVPRGVARSFRLAAADIDDVVQATWLALFKNIERIREPGDVASWLTTTARRESLRLLQSTGREHLTDDPRIGDGCDARGPEQEVLETEQREALSRCLASLPERDRQLMQLLANEADYRQISAAMAIAVGSIGPLRARTFERLQRHPELIGLRAVA